MNSLIKEIIKRRCENKYKLEALDSLSHDINIARGVIDGTYKYCEDCDDFYLAKSFITEKESKAANICTYHDPINSGGNEYKRGFIETTYEICPKGHKHKIDYKEY